MTTSDSEFPIARVAWTAVAVLLILYGLAFIDRQVLALMVGLIRTDLHISDFQVGLLQGLSFALLYSICGLPFGYAVDRLPRRLVIFFGVMVWALATTASGFVAGFGGLFLARFFVGMGEAALSPAAYSMLSDLFPPRKLTFALSIYTIGATIGGAAALALSALVVAHADAGGLDLIPGLRPWQAVFVIVGAPGLLLAFLIFLVPEPKRRQHRSGQASWGDMFRFIAARRRFFICHFGAFSCLMTLAYANLNWVPTFLIRHFGWSVPRAGSTMAVFQIVSGIVCLISTGRIVDWLWRRGYTDAHFRFYVAASLVAAVAGTVAFRMSSPYAYFPVIFFASLATNLAAIAASALQIITPNELRGRISALYLLVTSLIGMTLGPGLVSALTVFVFKDDSKINLSLSTTSLLVAPIACAFFWFGMKPMREAYAMRDQRD